MTLVHKVPFPDGTVIGHFVSQGSVTEDKASSSYVVVPIPTSLEEGEASDVVSEHSELCCTYSLCAKVLFSLRSRGVGATRDEER